MSTHSPTRSGAGAASSVAEDVAAASVGASAASSSSGSSASPSVVPPAASPTRSATAAAASSGSACPSFRPRRILIIGAGVFGVSAARSLVARYPSASVLLLEQSATWPPTRGASQDQNRIVRPDYGRDALYTRWGLDAMAGWRAFNARHGEEVYRPTGVLFLAGDQSMRPPSPSSPSSADDGAPKESYEYASYATLQSPPFSLALLPLRPGTAANPARSTLEKHFPYWQHQSTGSHVRTTQSGYYNLHGGHVNATRAIDLCVRELSAQTMTGGGHFQLRVDSKVIRIETEEETSAIVGGEARRRVVGVRLASGEFLAGDLVIAAAGAWTTALVPELAATITPAPQPVIWVRPNQDRVGDNPRLSPCADRPDCRDLSIYQDVPPMPIDPRDLSIPSSSSSVGAAAGISSSLASHPFPVFSFDLSRLGWYGFARDATGLVKIGHHGPGLREYIDPTAIAGGPDRPRWLSEKHLSDFSRFLRAHMPHLHAHGELVEARTCWYADTFDGHWLLDYHPNTSGLFVATGGSGHAFKFLPILGDIVVDLLSSRASPSTRGSVPSYASRFAWRVPDAATQRQFDVCRSSGVQAPTHIGQHEEGGEADAMNGPSRFPRASGAGAAPDLAADCREQGPRQSARGRAPTHLMTPASEAQHRRPQTEHRCQAREKLLKQNNRTGLGEGSMSQRGLTSKECNRDNT